MNNPALQVRILSPKQLILDTQALSVSSKNSQGPFDILPFHANFITVIENEPIIIGKQSKENVSFRFPIAIIFVSSNRVNIYTYD